MTLAEAEANLQRVVVYRRPGQPDQYGSIVKAGTFDVWVRYEGSTALWATPPEFLTLLSKVGQ